MSVEILSEYVRGSFAFFNGFWAFSNIYSMYPFIKYRKNEKEEEGKIEDEPKISVLLPAYKEESVIIKNVNRIEKADYGNLELLLITEKDDFKTDRISEYLSKKYGNIKHITLEGKKNRGKPRALNAGLEKATGNVIGVLDSEDSIDPGLFKKVAYNFSKHGYDAVQGRLRLKESNNTWLDRQFAAEYRCWYDGYLSRISKSGYILPFGGTTNFFRREILNELNGWEEGNLTEDYELAMRMYSNRQKDGKKYRIGYMDVITMEETPQNLKSWFKQRTRWSQGKISTSVKYMKKKDLDAGERIKIFASGINSFIGTINLAGLGLSAYMYASNIGMDSFSYLAYFNLSCIGAYCYLQGRAYYDSLKEKAEKHPYIKSAIVGGTLPLYWALQWVAGTRALIREIKGRKDWEKTMHVGTALNEKDGQTQR